MLTLGYSIDRLTLWNLVERHTLSWRSHNQSNHYEKIKYIQYNLHIMDIIYSHANPKPQPNKSHTQNHLLD